MAMINTDKPLSFANNGVEVSFLGELSVFCVACKNGYRPKFNPRFPLHVYECEAISSCQAGDVAFYNGCQTCQNGFTFGEKDGNIDYT